MQKRDWQISLALLAVAVVTLAALSGTALADAPSEWFRSHGHHYFRHEHAPELDPGSIRSGLALLAGASLLIIDRYRRRR